MSQNGKGDVRRPMSISPKQFASNWDTIFGKKKNTKKEKRK